MHHLDMNNFKNRTLVLNKTTIKLFLVQFSKKFGKPDWELQTGF